MAVARRFGCGYPPIVDVIEDQKYDSKNMGKLNMEMKDLVLDFHYLLRLFETDVSPRIKVMQMATGYMHMAVVTTDSRVFTRGDGIVGQLGFS